MIKSLVRVHSRRTASRRSPKRINLALQGGGAHGAFTWGVLDHLLEDGRLEIEGITGASAGAINAVLLADGLARGGREEARKRLADFWRAASLGGDLPDVQRKAVDRLFSFLPLEDSPMGIWFKAVSQYLSPYDFNPLNINPLKDLIERFVDFEAIRKCRDPAAVRHRHQCADRAAAHFLARQDHRRRDPRLGLPAAAVPRGRDRRRALLGRRLSRQPVDLPAVQQDADRGRAADPDQSAGAPHHADLQPGHREPAERDHVQFPADGRVARHRIRRRG